jgi:hypothetical protein
VREGIRAGNGVLRAVGSTRAAVDQAAAKQRPWATPGLPLVRRVLWVRGADDDPTDDDQETMIRWGVQGGHTVNARGRVACMRM